ncbi:unnamed protein product [Parascedosporium putredinis]|uniref:Uncharacterized protein n=1 Tax=Parascedosporium putredinis TaxID=1442378 RepID=A0A9P1HAD7_9PEZI|nr:unnamed protein product [Parascedosporium putredinis]CAI8001761.1 unnamed protein product [Parascedosporium putredinis]
MRARCPTRENPRKIAICVEHAASSASDLVFRVDNAATLEQRKRKQKKRQPSQQKPSPRSPGSSSPSSSSSGRSTPPSNTPEPSAALPGTETAVTVLRRQPPPASPTIVLPPATTPRRPHLPNLLRKAPRRIPLHRKVQLAACPAARRARGLVPGPDRGPVRGAAGGLVRDAQPVRCEDADVVYCRSVMAVRNALSDEGKRREDETLVAVWLLSLYEVTRGTPDPQGGPTPAAWEIHTDGILGILRARGPHQLATEQGRRIFWAMFTLVQTRALVAHAENPPEARAWLRLLADAAPASPTDRCRVVVSTYIMDVCAVTARIMRIVREGDAGVPASALADLFVEVARVEDAFANHPEVSAALAPELSPADSSSKAARFKLHYCVVRATGLALGMPVPPGMSNPPMVHAYDRYQIELRRLASFQVMTEVAAEILASAEALIGPLESRAQPGVVMIGSWVYGMRMLLPLIFVGTFCKEFSPDQSRRANQYLVRIARYMGIREAVKRIPQDS